MLSTYNELDYVSMLIILSFLSIFIFSYYKMLDMFRCSDFGAFYLLILLNG